MAAATASWRETVSTASGSPVGDDASCPAAGPRPAVAVPTAAICLTSGGISARHHSHTVSSRVKRPHPAHRTAIHHPPFGGIALPSGGARLLEAGGRRRQIPQQET